MNIDVIGRPIEQNYGRILSDPNFENRLRLFDKNLALFFDQGKERWVIMESAPNGTWNLIILCENKDGTPRAVGDWIFNELWVSRKKHDEKIRRGVTAWLNDMKYQAEQNDIKEKEKGSDDHQAMLREDVIQWRKASYSLQGKPRSDAIAGYRKV